VQHYQTIVIGCGGLGCATLYRLAGRLGPWVLGIEQFRLGHERGSSQDHRFSLARPAITDPAFGKVFHT